MDSLLAIVAAGCFTALGYFGRRWIEGHAGDQSLHRKQRVLEINKAMLEQKLTPAELSELEKVLLGGAKRGSPAEKTPFEREVVRRGGDLTQQELTHLAAIQLATANGELDLWVTKIGAVVGKTRGRALLNAQEHWVAFCEEQATLVASKYEGGSIMPMIYFIERERLVRERVEQLKRAHHDEVNV